MVAIPNERGDHYAAVKKCLSVQHAIPNQVITVSRILSKVYTILDQVTYVQHLSFTNSYLFMQTAKHRTFATKIAVQITAKLGGAPWQVVVPPLGSTMIVGFDTYHDTVTKGNSYGALVATLDKLYTK